MSTKEERFNLLDDDVTDRFLINDVVENNLLLNDKNCEISKNDIHVLSEKILDGNIIKKEVLISNIKKTSNDYLAYYAISCAMCQNLCKTCKHICVTCKFPCSKCVVRSCSSSTDTDDFDKYLESLSKKIKIQPKVKTIGTDTCDLEGHFDYYKLEKKNIRIQKDVATDCSDLILRKPVVKKFNKNTVAVDTRDLSAVLFKNEQKKESDCEFLWSEKQQTKTYSKKLNLGKISNLEKRCEDDISENSLVIDEDSSLQTSSKEEEDKENFSTMSNLKDASFNGSSTSDDSDIDLATSCKVSKCKQLAKKHNIKLKQIVNEKEVSYKCNICNKTFLKKYLGLLHLGNHIETNFLKCLTCNEKFSLLESLYSHIEKIHSDEGTNEGTPENNKFDRENRKNSETELLKSNIIKAYKCTLCCNEDDSSVQFNSSEEFCLHKKEKHDMEKTKSDEEETKIVKKPRIKREYICLFCGKQFRSGKALKDHSPVHTGEKNYHCDICNKSYTTNANLKIHKRTHTGAKDFVCTVCGKAFHKKDSLKVHFRKHSGERPFQCDLCPMKFDRNYILKNHRYTHFSEKKFICPVCGKTFTTHGGLNNHEKSHKKEPFAKKPRKPAVKPTLNTENAVICDVCGKIYSTKNNLRIHKFVHLGVKPFECAICHQTYAKKDSMLIHMRKHTDERPFACETCGMTFYRNHTLKTHLLRHTGERPHKCKMCGKSFTQSSSLTYHIRNHDKKVEKKKIVSNDPTKQRKKRIGLGNSKSGVAKKIPKTLKSTTEFQPEDVKPLFDDKKSTEESSPVPKDSEIINLPEKNVGDIIKGGHFMLPMISVPEKEIFILDKNLGIDFPKNIGKEIDIFSPDKDVSYNNQYNLSKFNYYIAKSHVFSFPKETLKSKTIAKEIEISIDKEEEMENLIISKNSYITKEGNLITFNKESSLKEVKEEIVDLGDQRVDLKPQTTIPIAGEILNAAFISDENGDIIPLGSMTLQGVNAENIMVSPFVPVESDDRKGLLRNSKLAVFDSKITYNLPSARMTNEKSPGKGNTHVINLKDSRVSQKIQIELDSPSLHIQTPVMDDGTLHGISGFYNNVQQNEI